MEKTFWKRCVAGLTADRLSTWLILLGIIVFARQYLFNRSFWLDESLLALNLIDCSVGEMLHQPLPRYIQAAPFGFCVIEKILISLFGAGEYVFRFFPFLCGCLSLWLFSEVAKRYLDRWFALAALVVFIVTPKMAYYASECKPYMADVAIVLLVLFMAEGWGKPRLTLGEVAFIGCVGAILIWFSFPVLFVLGGVGATLGVEAVVRKDKIKLGQWAGIILFWAASFLVCHFLLLKNIIHVQGPVPYWQDGYIGFAPGRTLIDIGKNILSDPMGLGSVWGLAGVFFLIGGYAFFTTDKKKFSFLFVPIGAMLVASVLHCYSCKGRLVLFFVPVFTLIIIQGIRYACARPMGAVIFLVLLYHASFLTFSHNLVHPREREEVRAVLAYVRVNSLPKDLLYVYSPGFTIFEYYRRMEELKNIEDVVSWNMNVGLKKQMQMLFGKSRVWLVFSHVLKTRDLKDDALCVDYLEQAGGIRLAQFQSVGASAYLFDLTHAVIPPRHNVPSVSRNSL